LLSTVCGCVVEIPSVQEKAQPWWKRILDVTVDVGALAVVGVGAGCERLRQQPLAAAVVHIHLRREAANAVLHSPTGARGDEVAEVRERRSLEMQSLPVGKHGDRPCPGRHERLVEHLGVVELDAADARASGVDS
jgi:hypothetical protein